MEHMPSRRKDADREIARGRHDTRVEGRFAGA